MRRSFLTSLLAFAIPCLAAGVLPSCATNDSMMFIEGVAVRKAGSCLVKPDLAGTFLEKGVLDLRLAKEYVAALIVGNQLTQRGSRERLRTETSKVALKGADVKLETSQGATLHDTFSSIGTGFVDASDGTDAAPGVMSVALIPASIAPTLPIGTVVVKIRVFGTTLGGEDVESSELLFPVEICNGCLIDFPASSVDPASDDGDFKCKQATGSADMTATSGTADTACVAGIDFPVDCTTCSSSNPACVSSKCAKDPTLETCTAK
jgi:hypothetical protein